MNEAQATNKADSVLKLILENCPETVGRATLLGEQAPAELAKSIAQFRSTLIAEFLKQPV